MKKIKSLFTLLALFFTQTLLAASSLGGVANVATNSFGYLAKVMFAIAYVTGGGFILSSLIQFHNHRMNSQQVRLSTPIWFFICGMALLLLPFFTTLSKSAVFLM